MSTNYSNLPAKIQSIIRLAMRFKVLLLTSMTVGSLESRQTIERNLGCSRDNATYAWYDV